MSELMNIDTAKSYKTEANLASALVKLGIHTFRHMVVLNRAGRFTAIFQLNRDEIHNAIYIANAGFKVFG